VRQILSFSTRKIQFFCAHYNERPSKCLKLSQEFIILNFCYKIWNALKARIIGEWNKVEILWYTFAVNNLHSGITYFLTFLKCGLFTKKANFKVKQRKFFCHSRTFYIELLSVTRESRYRPSLGPFFSNRFLYMGIYCMSRSANHRP
jgi:hypothetical protein